MKIYAHLRMLRNTCLALAAIVAAGCSGAITASSLDQPKAREALKTTLDAWQKGDEPSALKNASPAITAQDLDWMQGAKLVSFEVQSEGKGVDSNLKIPVKLVMKTKDGKDVSKTVNYLVTTSPSVTVFSRFSLINKEPFP